MLSGLFVKHDNPGEVDMLRLVESPPGHLSGSVVVSSVDDDGLRQKDAVYNVSGSITESNVSLQTDMFGSSANLIGTLSGGVLSLSAGSTTMQLREMSQKQYEAALAGLDAVAKQTAMMNQAKKAVEEAVSDDQQLNTDLKAYVQWGQQRITRVSSGRLWYTQRIDQYTKCLQAIQPLAATGVPSWRWQNCVLTVDNDKSKREQMAEAVRGIQSQNQLSIEHLNTRIDAAQGQFAKTLDAMNSSCPHTKRADACESAVRNIKAALPNGVLDAKLISDFRTIVPQVNAAIASDVQTSEEGESHLASLAQQAAKLYQTAH